MSEVKQFSDDEVKKIHEAAGGKQVSFTTLMAAMATPCPSTALFGICSACGDCGCVNLSENDEHKKSDGSLRHEGDDGGDLGQG